MHNRLNRKISGVTAAEGSGLANLESVRDPELLREQSSVDSEEAAARCVMTRRQNPPAVGHNVASKILWDKREASIDFDGGVNAHQRSGRCT
jgi:hypothetical protein